MTAEEWRAIPGFQGYEASSLGRVRSFRGRSVRILGGGLTIHGYRQVHLRLDGGSVSRSVHVLIAATFLGPRPPVPEGAYRIEVCHGDGDRLNNAVANLRYDTNIGNAADSIAHGTHTSLRQAAMTHCKRGHEFNPENTAIGVTGRGYTVRTCRKCSALKSARYAARKKQQTAA